MEPDDLDEEDETEFWVNIDQIPVQQEDTADTEPSRPRSKTPKGRPFSTWCVVVYKILSASSFRT